MKIYSTGYSSGYTSKTGTLSLVFSLDTDELKKFFGAGPYAGKTLHIGGNWNDLVVCSKMPQAGLHAVKMSPAKSWKNRTYHTFAITNNKIFSSPRYLFEPMTVNDDQVIWDLQSNSLAMGKLAMPPQRLNKDQRRAAWLQKHNLVAPTSMATPTNLQPSVQPAAQVQQPRVQATQHASAQPATMPAVVNTLGEVTKCVQDLKLLLANNPNLKLITSNGEKFREFSLIVE